MTAEKLLFHLEQPHGSGEIYFKWQNGPGNYIALTGCDSIVNIFDRYGQIRERIRLQGLCSDFGWDSDGDLLGIISQSSSQLILWDATNSKKQTVDIGLRDSMTCLFWCKTSPLVAVGTAKGNVSIYNHNTSRRTPIIGKHTKRITCGAWNIGNLLALGSEDKTLSISTADGDTLRVISLRADPADIQFSEMKHDERVGGENTISVIVGKRTLYLYNLLDPDNPIELAFQQHYGSIVAYKWYGDGYILLGFSAGFFIAISTHIKEVGQELFQLRNHKNALTDIAISSAINKVASCGDNNIKVHDMQNLQETSSIITLAHETGVEKIAWSPDGQLLACCTRSGSLNVYISHMPNLIAVCGPRIAVLSSLTEISLYNYTVDKSKLVAIPISLEMEPSFISVGPYHLAAGINNRIWLYDLTRPNPESEDTPLFLRDQQFLGAISSIKLNMEYMSVLFEGKIQLSIIEQTDTSNDDRGSIIFPSSDTSNLLITSHAITPEFLIYSTNHGHIIYFLIEDWSNALEYKHSASITNIHTDPSGGRLILIDENSNGFLFNAVNNDVIQIPEMRNKVNGVIWDSHVADRNIFIIYDDYDIDTYIYVKISVDGPSIKKVGKTTLVSKQIPLLMYSGEVMLAATGGQLTQLILSTHESNNLVADRDLSNMENLFKKQIALHKFADAWKTCQSINQQKFWAQLANETLKYLEIDHAIKIYRNMEDIGMVWSLETLLDVEDCRLLAGYIAMYLHEFDKAQQWFLSSCYPKAALEMRRDLLQWDQALQLAKKLAPDQIPFISREYAQQLEFTGNYAEAYVHYEKGMQDSGDDHNIMCKSGLARTSLRVGNYKHGISLAIEVNNKHLYKECADILESKKQLSDAASLYEKSQNYDKAASAYIKLKNWHKVGELLPNIASTKIHLQYAKAKEREGKYDQAAEAYHMAKDYDSVIRLQVEYLNNPEAAVELVQETKSVEGAKLVAKFFQRLNDYPSAIRFLVLSHCNDEAFDLARKHGKLSLYGDVLLNSISADEIKPQDFVSLALHFENERNSLLAGKYWFHAREFQKAMKHLLKAAKINSDENEALTIAIDVVASSNDDQLFTNLIEFLLGETDGVPKDPKYLFRLYMARKQYKEAAKTAIIIASEEQMNGNYRNAHDVLFSMYQELKHNGIRIPTEMVENLILLHSYILVRLHVKNGDHYKGARMLIRVANNISKFPSHVVPILTSTVIECHRAGLKQSAFTFAAMLMRSEYRSQVDPKYAKKIEAVVRKPPKIKDGEFGDPIEPNTPCPFCNALLPESEINCGKCKNSIPFCIATGRHILKDDLTMCPECNFPAIYTEFLSVLNVEDICPMCSEKVDPRRLSKLTSVESFLNRNIET